MMQSINKKIINISILLIPLLIIGIHAFMLINYGYIRDEYYRVNISDILASCLWIGIFLSMFATMVIYGLIALDKIRIAIIILGSLIIFSGSIIYNYYIFSRNYPLNVAEKTDYIDNNWLQGILLNQVDDYLFSPDKESYAMIYIGREDCIYCQEFEEELVKQCQLYSYKMPTYYLI